ncbi:MAG: hypothetical protein E7164_04060 [Firmicutes bacterium]|nr:hypothetical protein [Bacillota bacterium]
MNVIVSNKYQTLLSNLNIDVIKNINGVFSVDDLAVQFRNFFYNKMILDLTALENYEDINTIQRLSVALDMNKVILLLDDSPRVNSAMYLSQLVSMGIYNFTKNLDAITFLMDNPNSYKDVASFHQLNMTAEDIARQEQESNYSQGFIGQRIIGVKNLTDHAGSTTLTYLLKKHIENLYKVKAVEIGKHDFVYLNDNGLDSVSSFDLKNYLNKNTDQEVILIDLADEDVEQYCTDVIYLIEPGLIQLNRLIRQDNRVFEKMKGKKMVLNRSVLSNNDVSDFERESGSRVFYNLPNLDDKLDNIKVIKDFLIALGFTRFSDEDKGKSFGIFG